MEEKLRKVPVSDLNGLTPFNLLFDNTPDFVLQGKRVSALFEPTDTFYDLARRFNENEAVPVQDFLRCQREIRQKVLALKGGAK